VGEFIETGASAREPDQDSAGDVQDLVRIYDRADRELRLVLFGDDEYSIGCVKGEERRERVAIALRRMRQVFEAIKAEFERVQSEKARAAQVPMAPRRARKRAAQRRPAPSSPKRVRSKR
jgi:hypothetical protein